MCVLYVYLHVPLSGLDVLLDNGLYLFPLLILHSFSTFLHFYTPTHLHRILLTYHVISLVTFCWSCHYRRTPSMSITLSILLSLIVYPILSSLGWEHLLHLMSVCLSISVCLSVEIIVDGMMLFLGDLFSTDNRNQHLVLAYVMYFSVHWIRLLHGVLNYGVLWAVILYLFPIVHLATPLLNRWQATEGWGSRYFVTGFSVGQFGLCAGIYITERCISSCGKRSYQVRRIYA